MSYRGRGKHEQQKKRLKPLRIAMGTVAGLLVVLIVAVAFLINRIQNPQQLFTAAPAARTPVPVSASTSVPDRGEPAEPGNPDVGSEDAASEPDIDASDEFGQDRVNILLLGQDSSKERIEAGMNFRTDSMILVSFDLKTYDVDMISIPRDSYVRINGTEQHSKINAAFVYGGGAKKDGYRYAMDTVSWTLGGVRVDYYVGYGMQAVKDVVDAMGGIDYDVDIAFTMNGRRTEKGMQRLDGQKALDYARYRGGGRGDIDRVDRQQRLIFSMFEQMKSTGQIKNIPAIYTAVMDQIDTNLDFVQIAALAYWGLNLDMSNIDRHMVEGYGMMIGNTSYHVIDQNKKKNMIKEVFGVDIAIPEGEDHESIKIMAQEMSVRVSELMGLIDAVRQGIDAGYLADSGAQGALVTGQAALMSGKDAEVRDAIAMLSPYAAIQPPAGYAQPQDPAPGYTPPTEGESGQETGQGSLGGH